MKKNHDNQKAVAKVTGENEKDKPTLKAADMGTGEKNTSKKRKKTEEGNKDKCKNDKNKETDESGTDEKGVVVNSI